jgi:hypothetical protein
MAIDNVINLVIAAKNQAGPALKQVREQLRDTEKSAQNAGTQLNRRLALGAQVARAGLLGLAGAGAIVGAALYQVWAAADEAASSIAGMTGQGIEDIPKLRDSILALAGKNDNPFEDIVAAVKTVETAFRIFNPKDKDGLAQLLLDWRDATGQRIDEAGSNFRKLILLYFGPNADANKAFREIADKTLSVANAVGISPASLAGAVAELGATGRTYFKDFDQLLIFLSSIGASGGDVNAAAAALRTFGEKIAEVRKAWKSGEDPDKATLEAFKTLGLSRETIQNEGAKIGDLIMSSLKNAMKDGKLSEEEIAALNFLFGNRVGEDMALAASAVGQFSEAAQEALKNYSGALDRAAAVTDENIKSKLTAAWNGFLSQLAQSKQVEGVQQILLGLLQALSGLAALDWGKLSAGFADFGTGLFKLILGADPAKVADALVGWWDSTVIPNVKAFFSKQAIFGPFLEAGIAIWNALRSGINAALNGAAGVVATVQNLWAATVTAIRATWEKLAVEVQAVGATIWDALKNGWNAAMSGPAGAAAFLVNRWNDFRKGFKVWWDGIIEVGKNIIDGFWKGLEERWKDVKERVSKMGSEFIGWWKEKLGIKSPSTEMAAIGVFLIQGLTQGIDKALPGVRERVQGIVTAVVGSLSSLGSAITDLSKNQWTSGWANMANVMAGALGEISRYTDETTAGALKAWAGYVTAFGALMDKHKGNVLKAFGEMLIGIIEQELIKIAVTAAAQIAIAAINAPLTLGATLLAQGPILLAAAAGTAALEALKSRVLNSYDVGTPSVPADQLAIVHQGEMIIPRNFADAIRQGELVLGAGNSGQQPIIVQVYLDGRMVAEQVGRRMYDNLRQISRASLPLMGV